jgi:Flp pilus assembly protein TadG
MNLHGFLHRIWNSALAQALRDTRGAAAIEMAIITPAIMSLVIGTAELSGGFAVDRKVTITARALSDLAAQSPTITDTEMTNIFNAASSIVTPYAIAPLKAKVSAVSIDGNLNATVVWSSALNTSARPTGGVSIPAGLKVANSQLIWAEVSYDFSPVVAKFLASTVTLSDQFFARPRQSTTICRPPQVTTCS